MPPARLLLTLDVNSRSQESPRSNVNARDILHEYGCCSAGPAAARFASCVRASPALVKVIACSHIYVYRYMYIHIYIHAVASVCFIGAGAAEWPNNGGGKVNFQAARYVI